MNEETVELREALARAKAWAFFKDHGQVVTENQESQDCILLADAVVRQREDLALLHAYCEKVEGQVIQLRRALTDEQVRRVNYYADARRVIAWMRDPERSPANSAFTEGPERQIAYTFEGLEGRPHAR